MCCRRVGGRSSAPPSHKILGLAAYYSKASRQAAEEGSLRLRLRHDSKVGPRRLPALRILLLGILIAHRAGDDHILAIFPVHRRRDLVLGGELERVDDAQHLI